MDYFQETMRWETGQTWVSGKQDPNLCAWHWRAQLGFSKTQVCWAPPHGPAVEKRHPPPPPWPSCPFLWNLLLLRKHEGRWGGSFPERSTQGSEFNIPIFPVAAEKECCVMSPREDGDTLKQRCLHQGGSHTMSQALPSDHSGHISRVVWRVAYYCVISELTLTVTWKQKCT